MDKRFAVGNFICELRQEKGFTQKELGDLLGVTNKAVSKWENGAAMPRLDTVRQLADIFGCTTEEIFRGKRLCADEAKPDRTGAEKEASLHPACAARTESAKIVKAYIAEYDAVCTENAIKKFRRYKKITLIAGAAIVFIAVLGMVLHKSWSPEPGFFDMFLGFIDSFGIQLLIIGIGSIVASSIMLLMDIRPQEFGRVKKADLIVDIVLLVVSLWTVG